jgi:putative hydrolase of the HAD superfamily
VAGSRPRAVIFDFGGVIWDMKWDAARALEATHGLPQGSLHATLYGGDAWREVERGRGDRDAWLAGAHGALEQLAGRPLPPLHVEWRALQGPISQNVDLVRALRPRHRTGILSNADTTLRERLTSVIGIADLFDDIVCSAEVGLAKPEPEIYALACDRLGLSPGACVFVDDHEANVAAATGAGLRAILYRVDRGDDLRAQLATAGVVDTRS